jgi:hypothetical protein
MARSPVRCFVPGVVVTPVLLAIALLWPRFLEARLLCVSAKPYDDRTSAGTFTYQASTTQSGCSGRTTRVLGWFEEGAPFQCSGTRDPFGNCMASNAGGTATVTLFAAGCGSMKASSYHSYTEGGTTLPIGWNGPVSMWSPCGDPEPSPRADCDALGNEYFWDGDRCVPLNCPIVIATGERQDYRFTSAADGVRFDITGDGTLDQVAWTEPDAEVAFLALDRDGDGRITSAKELFGDHSVEGATNGFDALLRTALAFNAGAGGSVSSDDPLFSRLLLWTDANHNGVSEPWELRPAATLVSDIGLSYQVHNRRDRFGNRYRFRGYVLMRTAPGRNRSQSPREADTRRRWIYDVFLTTVPRQ